MRTPSGGFGMRASCEKSSRPRIFAGIGAVLLHHDTSPACRGGLARTSGLSAIVAAYWRTRKWQWPKMRSASTAQDTAVRRSRTGRRFSRPDVAVRQRLAGEFPDQGIVSPLTLGGTYLALQVETEDHRQCLRRRQMPGRRVPLARQHVLGGAARAVHRPVRSPLGCVSTCATCRPTRSSGKRRRQSGTVSREAAPERPSGCSGAAPSLPY